MYKSNVGKSLFGFKDYEKGEKLICIDNSGQQYITLGKVYTLLNEYSHSVGCQILNDNNDSDVYYSFKRFEILSERRSNKIDEILKTC